MIILLTMVFLLIFGFGFTYSLNNNTGKKIEEKEEPFDYYVSPSPVFKKDLDYKDLLKNEALEKENQVQIKPEPIKVKKEDPKIQEPKDPPMYKEACQSGILAYGSFDEKGFGMNSGLAPSSFFNSNSKRSAKDYISDIYKNLGGSKTDSETRINQKNKQKFIGNGGSKNITYLNHSIQKPISPYQVMAGTIFPAVLVTGINSDLPGSIIATIRENIFDSVSGKHLLVPQGTRLLGSYDNMISWGQSRVLLVWHRLIFPNGKSIFLDGMPGTDLKGSSGLKDKVNNHYRKITGAILMSAFLNIGAKHLEEDIDESGIIKEIGVALAKDVNSAGQKIIKKNLDIPPTLEIRPGFKFNIMVTKDIDLEAFKK